MPPLDTKNNFFVQLINEFKKQGHRIYVAAKDSTGQATRLTAENGISVLRIKSHDFTGVSNNVKKALAYQEYSLKKRYYVLKYFKNEKIDLIISHSLPPELGYIVNGIKKHFKCPFYLIQTDFTWQDAVAMGYFSIKHPAALYYKLCEKKMLKEADYIGCPTKGNIAFIQKYYPEIPDEKFHLLPWWSDICEIKKDDSLKHTLGLDNKFTIVYGGSVGAAQRIEHIVELADECKEYSDMAFVILGRGAYLEVIQQMVNNKGLSNVVFGPYLPQDKYNGFLASCDVGMIILNEKLGTPNFPSKSLPYLYMKVPILAALDYVTDFGDYLDENQIGLWAHSDNIPQLKDKLLEYYNSKDLRKRISENGYKLFQKELTTEKAYLKIMDKISKI